MCDDKLDEDGWFVFLQIRAKYSDTNPDAVLLHVRFHKSKFNQVVMAEMCVDELNATLDFLEKEAKKKPI